MARASVAQQLAKEQEALEKAKKKINDLKESEAKRILRLADKVGFFEVEIPDTAIEKAFSGLVKTARSSSN